MKKKSTKGNDEENHKLFRKKKIYENRTNLDKEPIETENKNPAQEQSIKQKNKKHKLWRRLGNRTKFADKEIKETYKETIETKDLDDSSSALDVGKSADVVTPKKDVLLKKKIGNVNNYLPKSLKSAISSERSHRKLLWDKKERSMREIVEGIEGSPETPKTIEKTVFREDFQDIVEDIFKYIDNAKSEVYIDLRCAYSRTGLIKDEPACGHQVLFYNNIR